MIRINAGGLSVLYPKALEHLVDTPEKVEAVKRRLEQSQRDFARELVDGRTERRSMRIPREREQ